MKLQFIEAGQIVTTHGVKGEMKVLPWVDGPDILCEFFLPVASFCLLYRKTSGFARTTKPSI